MSSVARLGHMTRPKAAYRIRFRVYRLFAPVETRAVTSTSNRSTIFDVLPRAGSTKCSKKELLPVMLLLNLRSRNLLSDVDSVMDFVSLDQNSMLHRDFHWGDGHWFAPLGSFDTDLAEAKTRLYGKGLCRKHWDASIAIFFYTVMKKLGIKISRSMGIRCTRALL